MNAGVALQLLGSGALALGMMAALTARGGLGRGCAAAAVIVSLVVFCVGGRISASPLAPAVAPQAAPRLSSLGIRGGNVAATFRIGHDQDVRLIPGIAAAARQLAAKLPETAGGARSVRLVLAVDHIHGGGGSGPLAVLTYDAAALRRIAAGASAAEILDPARAAIAAGAAPLNAKLLARECDDGSPELRRTRLCRAAAARENEGLLGRAWWLRR